MVGIDDSETLSGDSETRSENSETLPDGTETTSIVCTACGLQYRGRRTPSGTVVPSGDRETCRCGGTAFETWSERVAPPSTDGS